MDYHRFKILPGYLIIIILLLSASSLLAKNTVVTGTAAAFQGTTIRLIGYEDYISEKTYLIASDKVDKGGSFRLTFDISVTTYAVLELDFRKSEIYLIPGSFYDIIIKSENETQSNINPFLAEKVLDYEFVHAPDNDINPMMQELNLLYNTFIADKANFNALYRKRDKSKIEEFRKEVDHNIPDITNIYFNNSVKYKIASLEDVARIKSRNKIFEQYISDQSILYHHVGYMDFFNQFFNNYFLSSKQINKNELIDAVETRVDYFYLLDILGKDSLLRNEAIREMVMLKGLKDLYNTREFTQAKIVKILKDFSLKIKSEDHRMIANNLVSTMTKLKSGTKAPLFTLSDIKGNEVSLENFKGKYVYLFFWTSRCVPCTKEFEALSELFNKYKSEIEFLGISVDKEYSSMYHHLNKNNYPWINLHYADDNDLIENYEIKSYPLFVLINRAGNIIRYPAPLPSENIERLFITLLTKED